MAVVLVHLSDIHIRTASDPILGRASQIAKACFPKLPNADAIFLVVSGDIAFSGKREEYALANQFIGTVKNSLETESGKTVHVVLAPGNHDCNFDRGTASRDILVDHLAVSAQVNVDDSIIDSCTSVQEEYFEFVGSLGITRPEGMDRLWSTTEYNIKGKTLSFESINVSWMSKLEELPGRIYFPVESYSNKKDPVTDLRISVLHHPLNWFGQASYRPFRTFIRRISDIVVSGHEHVGNVGINEDTESEASAYIEGCVLQSGKRGAFDSSFNVVQIDLEAGQFNSTQFIWGEQRYEPNEQGSWNDYRNLPARRKSEFALEPGFVAVIDDPGAYLSKDGQSDFTLSDICVLPDVQKLEPGGGRSSPQNTSKFLRPENIACGVFIEGDEKLGKTSLLRYLFRSYHDKGYVPLLLRGQDIKSEKAAGIESAIERAVAVSYGTDRKVAFGQVSKEKKILLLDDLDQCAIQTTEARATILCALRARFGCMVVTTAEMFNLSEMIDGASTGELQGVEHYRIMQFGFVLRGKLISKWFALGGGGNQEKEDALNSVERAERMMDLVMSRSLIPRAPLYMLALLQSIELGRSGDFKDSALGYYYQYLITEALQKEGVRPEKLTEIFQFCAALAWRFHQSATDELTDSQLRQFNADFSEEWHTVEYRARINLLVAARILREVNGAYTFRYPYIYYYLKGLHLSQHLSEVEVRDYVVHCSEHLYVRDNANTILFLVHHTTDDFVLGSLSKALKSLFSNQKPLKFEGDTSNISELIDNAPKLIYVGGEPTDHRDQRNQIRDRLDTGGDGLLDSEERQSGTLSLLAQITMLFKTTEILGQVIKNQYAKIARRNKAALLCELFEGPLRALKDFLEYCEKNPDVLEKNIELALRKRSLKDESKRKEAAKRVVSSLIELVTFSFIARAADCVNSEELAEDVDAAIGKMKTRASRLIGIAIELDSPKRIPKQKLKALYKECKDELLAGRLIKLFVLRKLYMYRTSEPEIQWLSQEIELDINQQHKVAHQNRNRRLLK